MQKISFHIFSDLIRNKALVGYILLLSAVGWGVFMLETHPEKALLALMQVTLLVLPMICMVFATIYYYNSLEFILLLLAQPIKRSTLIGGFFIGLSTAFSLSFLLGIGLPLLVFHPSTESLILVLSGILLSLIFCAIALFVSTHTQDKARGMGVTLLVWAFLAFIYDGLLLLFMYQLSEYPIEKTVLVFTFFNPVDIARIFIIMKTEASAMLGLSGAVFQKFFGSTTGNITAVISLLVWTTIPFYFTKRKFLRKDM